MRKIEGLKFLQTFFFNDCINCVFPTKNELLANELLGKYDSQNLIFRVRSGIYIGPEIGCPQRTCYSVDEVINFITNTQKYNSNLEFVIHRVNESYFKPIFIGTIAIFEKPEPVMIIDFQAVSEELIAKMDSGGPRPRDWEVVATYCYPFFRGSPNVYILKSSFRAETIKNSIYYLWEIGRQVNLLMSENYGNFHETVTRFNIYSSGKIILDDHRSLTSFSGRI